MTLKGWARLVILIIILLLISGITSEAGAISNADLSGKIIVIDPGHTSGEDSRVISGEYEITHKIGPILKNLLIKDGATVYLTDEMGDTKEPFGDERAKFAISKKPDMFISIHTNANGQTARGVEVWTWGKNDKSGFREKELAQSIYDNVKKHTQQPSTRGLKEKNNPWDGNTPAYPYKNHVGIPILSDYNYPCPAVLVELDFTTYESSVDFNEKKYKNMRELMLSSEYQYAAAEALHSSIYNYFEDSNPPNIPSEDPKIVSETAQILDQSISPTSISPKGKLTFVFNINNPNSDSIQNVRLGAQIRTHNPQGAWKDDSINDKVVTLSKGTNKYSREFTVPQDASSGYYDARWVILDDKTETWINEKTMTRIFEVKTSSQQPVINAPAQILAQSISPTSISPKGKLTFVFNIKNPNSNSIQNVRLGAQIRTNNPQGAWKDDPANDKVVTLSPGAKDYSRTFTVPQDASSGYYDARWVILDDKTETWINEKTMTRIFEVKTSSQQPVINAPAQILAQSISPTSISPKGKLTFVFNIKNPNSNSIQNVRLGAQIRTNNPQGAWIDDPYNDKVVTLTPGTKDYSRTFTVPESVSSGHYDARWVILDDKTETWINEKTMTRIFEVKTQSTQAVLVTPQSQPPELDSIGDKSVYEKERLRFSISAKDPDDDKVTYSAENLPTGATISSTGRFTWTPDSGTAGNYNIKFIATANGLTDEETIIITVNEVADNPPELASIGDKSVYEKERLRFSISAKDPDGNKVTYSAEGLPSGAELSSSGRFTWTPVSGTADDYNVKFIATANGLTDEETIIITVNEVADNPPELAFIGDRSVYEKEKLSFRISAKDPDGDKVTYSVQGLPNEAEISNSGMINWISKSGRFTWTPVSGTADDYNVKFIATANGLTDEETITITVNEVVDNPPELAFIGDKSVYEKERLRFSISAKDPDGDKVTYSAEDLPSGAELSSSGRFTWTPVSETADDYNVKFIATANGLTDEETIIITVNGVADNPPEIAFIGDRSVNEKEKLSFSISAKDPDGDKVTYSAEGLPSGAELSSSGRFTWTPVSGTADDYNVKFIATANGLTDEETIIITVNGVADNPPEIASIDDNQGVSEPITQDTSDITLSISPDSGPQGTTFRFSGNGYTPSGVIEWHVLRPDKTKSVGKFTATGSGDLIKIHESTSKNAPGTYTVWAVDKATGRKSNEVMETITTEDSVIEDVPETIKQDTSEVTLSISPDSGPQGTTFSFSGNGYTPSGVIEWHVLRPDKTKSVGKFTATGSGDLIKIHESTSKNVPGTYTVWAVDKATGRKSNEVMETITTEDSVIEDVPETIKQDTSEVTLSISPDSGPQGTTFSFSGSGYTPNGVIEWHVLRPDKTKSVGKFTATGSGDLIKIHESTSKNAPGTYTVWAVDKATGRKSNEVTETIT